MKKIVINICFGGFGLSKKAILKYLELKGETPHFYIQPHTEDYMNSRTYIKVSEQEYLENNSLFGPTVFTKDLGPEFEWVNDDMIRNSYFYDHDIERDDPILIEVVELLGKEANGDYAELRIVEIPDDVEWIISEYDGKERIEESHRSWS